MSLSLSSFSFTRFSHISSSPINSLSPLKPQVGTIKSRRLSFSVSAKVKSKDLSKSRNDGPSGRQVWRRRKLTKKDDYMEAKLERVPFLEEQVRKMNEGGGVLSGDIDRLMKSEDNRFEFVNGVAAEAKSYVENNRDDYGAKKPILHVLSNRMNEAGFDRPEAYMETDPFVPGPTYLKEFFT